MLGYLARRLDEVLALEPFDESEHVVGVVQRPQRVLLLAPSAAAGTAMVRHDAGLQAFSSRPHPTRTSGVAACSALCSPTEPRPTRTASTTSPSCTTPHSPLGARFTISFLLFGISFF